MSQVISETEGVVDKYIGDGIMALWNAPYTVIDHPSKACEAALLCKSRLETLKADWKRRGYPEMRMRVGIHTGNAIVGNFGSVDRLNYTALGDNVNLASIDLADLYTEAFELYMDRQFEMAAVLFVEYLESNANDKAAETHLKACRHYVLNPPDSSWDGTRRMNTK
ncbi:hypothetical protein SARC_09545 [Sphaeroforma arctica JP610]|uniref:Guanylate cyclase domain-containing protein n=1 Tax=Sphaeroforma arctica JP610 TaxID=667725 RepID=A0A0L0FMN2_9EUKA|nr:hypothetical protein SARC_09545 [Sphaeroforma arctica JP610]KNC78012.1 hypothetical protein SARC_09545 [Sphaeroforma arctica JP610]|eukprot:XP_014151914.1 hypothetical protein SARC_09545 [Sphaeroforma arctica JP610]